MCLMQVYVLEVRWSEGTTTIVFRRYSDFFEFQVSSYSTCTPETSPVHVHIVVLSCLSLLN